ncbi:MAG: PHP domain-containing protein [Candidatus Aminicenantes bacterium]|nr:PHP domain-containing protein [Candidatus Aminicenantes bacterium]
MKIRKFLFRLVLLALLIYVLWAGWQVVRFHRYESPAPALSTAASSGPSLYEVEGAYHMHSRYSDGRKTVDQIAKVAAGAGLDFIVLTDHGRPNFAALDAQGKKEGVLVLAGSEISSNRGHLVALGFDRPDNSFSFSSDAEIAAREISERGGFSVVAHPYSKIRWSWGDIFDYSGLEIIDADSMIKSHIVRSLPYYPLLLIKPTLALLKMIVPPDQTLRKWDQLLARGPANGYFSADAHLLYSAIFPVFHLHVLLDRPPDADFAAARRQIFDALKSGRFYSAVDGAAAARGFRTSLEGGSLRVSAPFSFAHETVIIHDGKAILRINSWDKAPWKEGRERSDRWEETPTKGFLPRVTRRTSENELIVPLSAPGAYRVEVYLRERTPLNPGVPWIISNPVYVKGRAFGSPLARGLYPRASTAEVDPRAKPGAPAAVERNNR